MIWADFTAARQGRHHLDLLNFVLWEQYKGNHTLSFEAPSGPASATIYRDRSAARNRKSNSRPLNLIGRNVDIAVAKQMKAEPVFDAVAATAEPRDVLAARSARDYLRHTYRAHKFSSRRRELFLDRVITGNAFVKVQFNPSSAPFRDQEQTIPCGRCQGMGFDPEMIGQTSFDSTGMPKLAPDRCQACGGEGVLVTGVKRVPMGDVDFPFVRPWEIYPNESAVSVEQCEHIFHAYRLHPRTAEVRFGMSKGDIERAGTLEEGESEFAKLARDVRFMPRDEDEANTVWVVEKHMPPLAGEESPRISIMAGNRLVYPKPGKGKGDSETPWAPRMERSGRIPIVHFRFRPMPMRFWAQGNVLDAISSNDTVNTGRESFYRHLKSMSATKWFAEVGSIKEHSLTTEIGEVVEYEPGLKAPYSDRPAPMSDFYERLVQRESDRVSEMFGVTEIDRGIALKNVEAAEAYQIIVEQSETSLGPIVTDDRDQWSALGELALHCAKAHYKAEEKRFVLIGGSGSELEAKALEVADLSARVSVVCTIGSALSVNLAMRRNQLLQLWEKKVIDDPRYILTEGEFGLGDGNWIQNDARLQESAAIMENEQMVKGGPPHQVLLGVHDNVIHAHCHRVAALRAQIAGDMNAATMLAQAAVAHEMAAAGVQQPAPPPAGAQPGQPLPLEPTGMPGPAAPQPVPGQLPFDSSGGPAAYNAPGLIPAGA